MAIVSLSLLILTASIFIYRNRVATWSIISSYFPRQRIPRPDDVQNDRHAAKEHTEASATAMVQDEEPTTTDMNTPSIAIDDSMSEGTAINVSKVTPPSSTSSFQGRTSQTSSPPTENPSTLMPPPPRPHPGTNRSPAKTTSSLRVPSNGPLPNRLPTPSTNSSSLRPLPSSSSQLSTSTLAKPRKKVELKPGHSPLDWAALTRSTSASSIQRLTGLPAGTPLQRITPSQLARANGRKGAPAWAAFRGKVYNIAAYLPFHPGGEGELLRAAGKGAKGEAEKLFVEIHPWVNLGMIDACVVGVLVAEDEAEKESEFEALD